MSGNTKYYYKVYSYNTAGNSAASNVASDTTAPQAPSALTAASQGGTPTGWDKVNLSWTDNANSEVGFKIERSADNVTFTQIATNAASDTTYTDSGLLAQHTYYFRVRSYNANGNSTYSNTASVATPNAPPVLNAIGNKSVAPGNILAFTAAASDPNKSVVTTTFATFEGTADGTMEQMFRKPANSSTTLGFIDTVATNYSMVRTAGMPAGGGGTHAVKAGWTFKSTAGANYWVRFNTFGAPTWPDPTIALDQILRFKIYSSKAIKVGLGIRETGTTAAYGADGGTTGAIEWVGVTNVVSGNPIPNRLVTATNWTTLSFNIPFEPQAAFTGDGVVPQSGVKGVLEHLVLQGAGGTGAYTVWVDDIAVVAQNTLAFSLDSGAPAGASIERRTGKFTWTPTSAQVGIWNITVRVTDQGGAQDFETIKVTVLSNGNNPPVLGAIGNKTVNEGTALTFTATATDVDAGQTLTYSLDAGAPAGASISASSGAFSWTPTEAQGPGSYPVTIRVTDNGSPSSNDFEAITITVTEVNSAPALAAISDQSVNEGSTLTLTASATDSDVPANTLSYSLETGAPAGMTINASSGVITWTPGESDGPNVYPVTVKATDNGSPALSSRQSFAVTVNELNVAPVLTLGTSMTSVDVIADFETEDAGAGNGSVMFRPPIYSGSSSAFLDTSIANYTEILNTTNYPGFDSNTSAQVLHATWGFKTGTTNPWIRLTTYTSASYTNTYSTPNPTIDLGQRLRLKIYSDKSIKIGLGVRETGVAVPNGFDGGTTGTMEWVGVTSSVNGQPQCSRTVNASNWTTLEFNLPIEPITAFTGNGVLASGKGTLEHLAIIPNGGMGQYNIYVDDFEVVTVSTNLTINTLDTITVTNSATDADLPANGLAFSLGVSAPAGAVIDPATGVFTWTPGAAQSGTAYDIPITVTDDGVPALSDTKNLHVVVNKVNTPPRIGGLPDQVLEASSGQTVTFTATAEDDDVPADTLTFSLTGGVPSGATIDGATGSFSWTPPAGNSTNTFNVRVTDNGSPSLYDERSITILVVPVNTAPTLSLGTARVTEPVITFETFTNNTPNEQVLFNKPANSSTTTNYIDTTATNYTTVTTAFPAGNSRAAAKVMKVGWTFKTGQVDQWVRLNTLNATKLPNPAINASAHLKFDVYTTKSLKVAVGIRETGTTAENGANGGTTGAVEYVGCSSKSGTTPIPTRTVAANTWTTLEFDLPNEPVQTLTGNGVLSPGQQVLEHLVLYGAGGTGAYTVYLDNFEVVTTAVLPSTVGMKANSTLTFTASGSDPDPGSGLTFGIDADFQEAHPTATIDATTGAFSWTPSGTDAGTTNSLTVAAEDNPTNGGVPKADANTFSIVVVADTLAAQGGDAQGGTLTLTWDSLSGTTYKVQSQIATGEWIDVQTVQASGNVTNAQVAAGAVYRVVALDIESSGQ